jgi:energy-coupling factor transporter ATP-binding protein EcfA2
MDQKILSMLIDNLRKNRKLEVIFDQDLRAGDKVDEFMSMITQCHAVLVLCTPEYHNRVSKRIGGVYHEYDLIINAYEKLTLETEREFENNIPTSNNTDDRLVNPPDRLEQLGTFYRDKRFTILPILISGAPETSVPSEFQNRIWEDFVGMIARKSKNRKQYQPSTHFRNKFRHAISSIEQTTLNIFEFRRKEYIKDAAEIFRKIFYNLKHDSENYDKTTLEQLFVKQFEYKKVEKQEAYILVGRKGTGKSTLIDYLTHGISAIRKFPIKINVNEFPMEFIFGFLNSAPHKSDRVFITVRSTLMQFAWEGMLYFCCFEALGREFDSGNLNKDQQESYKVIEKLVNSLISEVDYEKISEQFEKYENYQSHVINTYFVYALTVANRHLSELIEQAPSENEEEFNLYVTRVASIEHYLSRLFGPDLLSHFYSIVEKCSRCFLISLDGFDTQFQRFRKNTLREYTNSELYSDRIRLEIDWLEGLFSTIRRCKGPERSSPLAGNVHFCITVPKDRFLEVNREDRDAYQFGGLCLEVSWTGIELQILLRKRLGGL